MSPSHSHLFLCCQEQKLILSLLLDVELFDAFDECIFNFAQAGVELYWDHTLEDEACNEELKQLWFQSKRGTHLLLNLLLTCRVWWLEVRGTEYLHKLGQGLENIFFILCRLESPTAFEKRLFSISFLNLGQLCLQESRNSFIHNIDCLDMSLFQCQKQILNVGAQIGTS